MTQYEHLKIFKKAYEFDLYFIKLSRGFPKEFKYGLAAEVRTQISYVLNQIILANNAKNKLPYLTRSLVSLELIKIKIRLLRDLKAMRVGSYKYSAITLTDLSTQIAAWKNWALNDRIKSRQT